MHFKWGHQRDSASMSLVVGEHSSESDVFLCAPKIFLNFHKLFA
jgi:hypothetical protein